ncbi:hypothetical protein ACFP1Z_10430 [Streptomyces gamaensis]|uniref:Uncharacterized protein n=1 Tax=Streptomyces gamaensis TaxID=1763542 RepID=A0ABW0YYH4_9ACTN
MDVPHPVLAVAMAENCSFCHRLRADVAANHTAMKRLRATVLLTGDGGTAAFGKPLDRILMSELARARADMKPLGTPTAVRARPGAEPALFRGYDRVTAALAELSGAAPGQVVCETPSSCSVKVSSEPVDALVTARSGGRVVGVAARGQDAMAVVARCTEPAAGATVYAPITLLLERPERLYLLYRGGELIGRLRSAEHAGEMLRRVLAGFASSPSGAGAEVRVLCGAVVRPAAAGALLFPRHWMTHLVKHASRLERAGWEVCPDPFTRLRPGPDWSVLLSGRPAPAPVVGVLIDRTGRPGADVRTRDLLLAQVVNWIARPTAPEEAQRLAGLLYPLLFHVGTVDEALSFLGAQPSP